MLHWPLMGGLSDLVHRWWVWARCGPAQAHRRCTKCTTINGSVENMQRRTTAQRRHCGVSLNHDRTSGTEKWPFWHRGRLTHSWADRSSSHQHTGRSFAYVWGDMVDVIMCNIWWLSVKGCGCSERGKFAFSHWLNASPLQHWSHCRVTVWLLLLPGAILTKCGLWGDRVDVIMCAIFRDCRLRGVGVVRGVSLPSPIDFTRRPYNTGHTTVWPCDRASAYQRAILI